MSEFEIDIDKETLEDLNAQTAKITWEELARHYAHGTVIKVATDLDLVDVAFNMVKNRTEIFEQWTNEGKVARASDEDARNWVEADPLFWAVVAAPWVLVQEIEATKH